MGTSESNSGSIVGHPLLTASVLLSKCKKKGPTPSPSIFSLPETWSLSVAMVRKGGRVCLFGGCAAGAKVELETHRIHYNEIALFGVFHHRPGYVRQAIELLGNGAVPTELLIGGRISLEDLVSFFAENRDTNPLKAAVIM